MSRYLQSWNIAKGLDPTERKGWISKLEPAKGIFVDFLGLLVIDIDLLEALNYYDKKGNHG